MAQVCAIEGSHILIRGKLAPPKNGGGGGQQFPSILFANQDVVVLII